MRYPFEFIPSAWWPRFFWPLFALTLALIIVFGVTGAPLTTAAAPYGIVTYELAGTVAQAQQIIASWNAAAQARAAFGLGLDYLFMLAYASTIVLGCGMTSQVLRDNTWPLAGLATWLGWGVILAAVLDAVENIALITMLLGNISSPWPAIARWCAWPKFGLIFIGIVYVLYGVAVALVVRLSPRK